MKAKPIMIQGTASSVGKSLITAGLCRIFKQDGYKVAPFKSQNMALNSFITKNGAEMGRAQVVQAEAAGAEPTAEMNPVLLKPTTDQKCQVILNGKVYGNMSAMEYYNFKPQLGQMVKKTYDNLAIRNDVVVIEGAGSPAEINLRDNDIVNMGMAELAGSPVVLVGDIDKGGVFAALAGTMLLLQPEEKKRVKGVIINKFRGDVKILEPGLKMLEEIIKIPVLGVVPYTDLNIEDEDSLTERFNKGRKSSLSEIDVVIVRLPHISNFTDFNSLENIPGVSLRYVRELKELGTPDLIIIPGSKNTIEDLLFIRKSGLEQAIKRLNSNGAIIFGICGGYQMLGKQISDPEHTESNLEKIEGMGLLDANTVFRSEKVTTQVEGKVCLNEGLLKECFGCKIYGYEIHMGVTEFQESKPFISLTSVMDEESSQNGGMVNKNGTVFGTYVHGIFDSADFAKGFINGIRGKKGLSAVTEEMIDFKEFKNQQYDMLADILRKSLDMDKIYEIIGLRK